MLFTLKYLEVTIFRYPCWMTSKMFHVSKSSDDLGGFATRTIAVYVTWGSCCLTVLTQFLCQIQKKKSCLSKSY